MIRQFLLDVIPPFMFLLVVLLVYDLSYLVANEISKLLNKRR